MKGNTIILLDIALQFNSKCENISSPCMIYVSDYINQFQLKNIHTELNPILSCTISFGVV